MVKKLLHTRMRVNDLAATVKFYQEALGLKLTRQHTSPRGAQLAFLSTPNSDEEIELCQTTWRSLRRSSKRRATS
jgi:lactoylglutathione lyase